MRRLAALWLAVLLPLSARAASIVDATGRTVAIPDHVLRIVPAGPPAAMLLASLAPDLMVGWPEPLSPAQRAFVSPRAASLPTIPRLTGPVDPTGAIAALHPDLILDYGTVNARYVALDDGMQARTGVPTILLDGAIGHIAQTLRSLGAALHRQARAEQLAAASTRVLNGAHAAAGTTVVYARGPSGLVLAAPGAKAAEPFDALGWRLLAPAGQGAFRHVGGPGVIARLDPDIVVFEDEAARRMLAASPTWQAVRAVRTGHAFVAPNLPFGWFGRPPSINRLLGIAAFAGGTPRPAPAVSLLATLTGRAPSADQLMTIETALRPIGQGRGSN